MRRFFVSLPSSFSLSLAAAASLGRLVAPVDVVGVRAEAGPSALLRGVSGGVVIGTPVTLPELAAAIPGTLPTINEGFEMTLPPAPPVPGAADETVTTDEVELERAGDDGRMLTNDAVGGGDGAVNELAESRWRCCEPWKGDGGAKTDVGVGTGVFWLEDDAVPVKLCFDDKSSPV